MLKKAIICSLFVLAACSAEDSRTYIYSCGDSRAVAEYFDNDVLKLTFGGNRYVLNHAVSADGAKYADTDENIVFWNKGRKAYLEISGKQYPECSEISAQ